VASPSFIVLAPPAICYSLSVYYMYLSYQVKQLGSGKMRRERTNHYSRAEDDEMPVAVDLPTSFTLPISNMPSFNFMASKPIGESSS